MELSKSLKRVDAIVEKLCKKGKNYIAKRKRAGEKSSAYLSGRAVKVCKGQMKGEALDPVGKEDEDLNKSGGYFQKSIDLEFIDTARAAMSDGKKVYYNSWW